LLWSLGGATPFYHIPYAIIPGTKYFRAPATIFFVGTLAISILACAGAERLLEGRVSRKYLLGWLIGAGAIALLASAGALTSFAESFAVDRQLDGVRANSGAMIAGAWRSFAFVALAAALGLATLRGRISTRTAAWALAALLTIDLWTVERLYWMFSPPAKVIYASDPIVDMLRAEPQPVRVLAIPFQQPDQPDAFLTGDALMTYRIRNVLGYHGNQLAKPCARERPGSKCIGGCSLPLQIHRRPSLFVARASWRQGAGRPGPGDGSEPEVRGEASGAFRYVR
jgi:hypothetical protein